MTQENWVLLGLNTVIVVITLLILFKLQDNKIKMYFKKIEKKMKPQAQYRNEDRLTNTQQMQAPPPVVNPVTIMPPSDIDSFVDPLQQ